jgi:hypothetical protein
VPDGRIVAASGVAAERAITVGGVAVTGCVLKKRIRTAGGVAYAVVF